MRKRFGAIHSETTEEFMEAAQKAWEQDLYYYHQNSKSPIYQQMSDFNFGETETNTSNQSEEEQEGHNIKIFVVDSGGGLKEIEQFCEADICGNTNFQLEYCSRRKDIGTKNKQVHFHYWIQNMHNTKYQAIINGIGVFQAVVYLKNCDYCIYLYERENEDHFQYFLKLMGLNQKPITVFKIYQHAVRTNSNSNLADLNSELTVVTLRSLKDALSRIDYEQI